jgi:hypothetical protein
LISVVYLSSKKVMTQKGSLVFCSFRSAQSYWSSRQLGQLLLHIPTVVYLICWWTIAGREEGKSHSLPTIRCPRHCVQGFRVWRGRP